MESSDSTSGLGRGAGLKQGRLRREGAWHGVLDPTELRTEMVEEIDAVADAAREADWPRVLRILDAGEWVDVNCFRMAGRSWYTPLHQSAWHGAPAEVVEELLARGAWRAVRTAAGERAADIARGRGHHDLAELLIPELTVVDSPRIFAAWDRHLAALVESRIRPELGVSLRHLSTEVLAEKGVGSLWFPVPGMYGGFNVEIFKSRLHVESWSRVVGGSGQAHVITEKGATLVEEGFV